VPQNLRIEKQAWMNAVEQKNIYKQDWYFGYLQTAGFNTTILKAVLQNTDIHVDALLLSEILEKMPLTDAIFQQVIGDSSLSLEQASKNGLLYACDYSMFTDISHDTETAPIFTPNDASDNNDKNGAKWQIAKTTVLNTSAIQHETVAHLGACHLVIEPMVVASHRQLPKDHPLLILLTPHFRFTLEINNGAIHSLIVPGGVVASVLSSSIEGSGKLIVDANEKWRFDEHIPSTLFKRRGVSDDNLPAFPFREDTLELWTAIRSFVHDYLALYYTGAND